MTRFLSIIKVLMMALFCVIAQLDYVNAQTNPTAFDLASGDWTLTGWKSDIGAGRYPTNGSTGNSATVGSSSTAGSYNMIFWKHGTGDPVINTTANANYTGSYANAGGTVFGNNTNGIGFNNTGGAGIGSAVLAIKTIGRSSIKVKWTARQLTGSSGRTYSIRLMYRVGTTGSFQDANNILANIEYTSGSSTGEKVMPEITLPIDAENKPVVQLMWLYYNSATFSGARPSMGIDDITVSASIAGPIVTTTSNSGVIGTDNAYLTGTINANNKTVAASFDYGLNASYGTSVAASPASVTGATPTAIDAYISSLSPNTPYHYRAVGTADGVTTYGGDMSFYTLANTPGAVVVSNPQFTTLDIALNSASQNGNPVSTQYALHETSTNRFVQADGSLGATAVWQTAVVWGTKTVTGLASGTTYAFETKARNASNVETASGSSASGTTLTPPTVDYAEIQFPKTTQTMLETGQLDVYLQAYEPGLTNTPGEKSNLHAWVGYSSTNNSPAGTGWTWIPATYNEIIGNNDEYKGTLQNLAPGKYYYAGRFQIDAGPFVYAGTNGKWANDSVELNVNADAVSYANVYFNDGSTVLEGFNKTIYAQAYQSGVTEAPGPGAGITAQIGYSKTNGVPDNSWTWENAVFNAQVGNNDEYRISLGAALEPGTYFIASRFIKAGSSTYVYGGSTGVWSNNSIVLTVQPDVVDYANIQSPPAVSTTQCSAVTIYAQVYEPGTEPAGQLAGITAEIGYSSTNAPPDGTWTWLPATYNPSPLIPNNNDEYYASIGANLPPGTYYYASRFKKSTSSTYVYGGTNGVWNNDSGVLTVTALAAPVVTAATDRLQNSFTANWEAVPGASGYILDMYTISGSFATDLFISEYVEGSSNNKYIEIFNGTGASVDLSDYRLRLFANGVAADKPTNDVQLSGTLAHNSTIVYKNSSATIFTGSAEENSATNFNGDDALALFKISTQSNVDIFGKIGFDPGTKWFIDPYSTLDKTLVRKSNVTGGITVNPSVTTPAEATFPTLATEWDQFEIDNVSHLGAHNFSGATVVYILQNENVGNVTSYPISGLSPNTKYFYRVRALNGACVSANSNVIEVNTKPTATTYNGSVANDWDLGLPDADVAAAVNGNYTVGAHLKSKTLTINSGASLTIPADKSFTTGTFTNNGTVIVESDGNFVQTTGSTNSGSGTFTVKRNARMKRLDYTYWGSPVNGQMLKAFSPGTLNGRFMVYDESTDFFSAIPDPVNTPFATAKGYAIRADNRYPAWSGTAPESAYRDFVGTFTGAPHNGDQTFNLEKTGHGYNLVGNPYPSNIDFHALAATGTIQGVAYFWTNFNPTPEQQGSNYSGANYAVYTVGSGGIPSSGSDINDKPEQYIKVGQGFIVKANDPVTVLTFTNALRNDGTGESRFINRNGTPESIDRFWLTLTTPLQNFNTLLIAYPKGATNGFESNADAKQMGESSDAFYSVLEDRKLVIQGRQFPLLTTDKVNLGLKAFEAGTHRIALAKAEGIFEGGQKIYLKDKVTGTLTDLTQNEYSFTTESGYAEGRFEIVYEPGAVLGTVGAAKDDLLIYRDGTDVVIRSKSKEITGVELFDMAGRLLQKQKTSQNVVRLKAEAFSAGTYILRIDRNGEMTSRKIIR